MCGPGDVCGMHSELMVRWHMYVVAGYVDACARAGVMVTETVNVSMTDIISKAGESQKVIDENKKESEKLTGTLRNGVTKTGHTQGIMEYKSVEQMKMLESDRKEYRAWQEDLKIILGQVRPDFQASLQINHSLF